MWSLTDCVYFVYVVEGRNARKTFAIKFTIKTHWIKWVSVKCLILLLNWKPFFVVYYTTTYFLGLVDGNIQYYFLWSGSPKDREFERTSICHGSLVEIEIFKEGGVVDAYYKWKSYPGKGVTMEICWKSKISPVKDRRNFVGVINILRLE